MFKLSIILIFLIGASILANEEGSAEKKEPQKKVEEAGEVPAAKTSKSNNNEESMTLEEEKQRGILQRSIEEPRISNKWFRGNYLIYDCDKGFYACVNSVSFEKCEYQRKTRIDRRQPNIACAPLKRFDTQKECFKIQYEKMHNQVPKLFCVHPNFR